MTLPVEDASARLRQALPLDEGQSPFPWQEALLTKLLMGELPRALDVPTGLGKTEVMAIWLVARACGARVPRRLVYVVDRQAVVDQATERAEELRSVVTRHAWSVALGLGARPLPISTLRGKRADNRAWLEDPSAPAIIVGTVDMIGSRLLFEGYRASPKMRPYQAGLIGADTLLVLDEAHLVPPFERLVEQIASDPSLTPVGPLRDLVPRLHLMSLSATGRDLGNQAHALGPRDLEHPVVLQRLNACKRVTFVDAGGDELAERLASEAWDLLLRAPPDPRVIVFCDKKKDAEKVHARIAKLAKGDKASGRSAVAIHPPELFVGGRRIYERQKVRDTLLALGFIGPKQVRTAPAFVIATSAGEVGVDLDADHAACDLVSWERMVQRFGRVNRRGTPGLRSAVRVVVAGPGKEQAASEGQAPSQRAVFDALPVNDEGHDVSPGALRTLKARAREDAGLREMIAQASTEEPLRPALTRPLVDAWAMTSLSEHTGRPEVDPWLRGWLPKDPPQTAVIWRRLLPLDAASAPLAPKDVQRFFEAAPPHQSELLEADTHVVGQWLEERAKALRNDTDGDVSPATDHLTGVLAFVLARDGRYERVLRLHDSTFVEIKSDARKDAWLAMLATRTLVVDARVAGLREGLLAPGESETPATLDGPEWVAAEHIGYRVRVSDADQPPADGRWRSRLRLETATGDEEGRWLLVDKWRTEAATEDDRSTAKQLQLLVDHQRWARQAAETLATRLGLTGPAQPYADMLAIAAELHDEGKRAECWQRAFQAPTDGRLYAKTPGPILQGRLGRYRHELGSLPHAVRDARIAALPEQLRDLALHLIVAHHGFGRPWICTDGCDDGPPSLIAERAEMVALRFARLMRRWGPWGLAWWEAILRAADQMASRRLEEDGDA